MEHTCFTSLRYFSVLVGNAEVLKYFSKNGVRAGGNLPFIQEYVVWQITESAVILTFLKDIKLPRIHYICVLPLSEQENTYPSVLTGW